jgi:hypothetical protein
MCFAPPTRSPILLAELVSVMAGGVIPDRTHAIGCSFGGLGLRGAGGSVRFIAALLALEVAFDVTLTRAPLRDTSSMFKPEPAYP